MTLEDLQVGQILTVRVYKRFGSEFWANNYEVQALDLGSSAYQSVLAMAQTIASWEATFHLPDVAIDRVVVSTVQPDSRPYNPLTFLTINLQLTGGRNVGGGGGALPLEACLFVRKVANYGRNGKLLFRGVLLENDLNTSGFQPLLYQSSINLLNTQIQAIMNNQSFNAAWRFVLFDVRNLIIRGVQSLVINPTITFKKRTNAYFDRRTTGSGGN